MKRGERMNFGYDEIQDILKELSDYVDENGLYCFDISEDDIRSEGWDNVLFSYLEVKKYPYFELVDTLNKMVSEYPKTLADKLLEEYMSEEYRNLSYEDANAVSHELSEFLSDKIKAYYIMEKVLCRIVDVDIGIDTGDSGYEFRANCIYPAYDRYYSFEEVIHESPIVWIAKQQGHKASEVGFALKHIVNNPEKITNGFIKSLAYEVWHEMCDTNQLYFFAKMTISDVLILNSLMKWSYETKKWGGYIILNKEATTGFYCSSLGCSSLLGIKPENEVKIPLKLIHNVSPDEAKSSEGRFGWSLKSVVDSSAPWEKGRVLYMSLPKHFRLAMEDMGLEAVKKNERRTYPLDF